MNVQLRPAGIAPRARAKRNALLLALAAAGVYAATIIWHLTRSAV
jgi:hypothetical protein